MAHFALLNANNIVLDVIVVHNNVLTDENGIEQESRGKEFCANLFGGNWVQTSYNASFRKNYAAIGALYDAEVDAFSKGAQPYPSWILNKETMEWEPPTPKPNLCIGCIWSEERLNWIKPKGT